MTSRLALDHGAVIPDFPEEGAGHGLQRRGEFHQHEAVLIDQTRAVSPSTTDADVWLDPTLLQSLFLSGPLGDALVAAGLRESFRLYKARLV